MVKKGREHWVTGNECSKCAVDFSIFQRKHNCRRCGEVFCSKCCSVKCPVVAVTRLDEPDYEVKDKAVCDKCMENWLDSPEEKFLVGKKQCKIEQLGIQLEKNGWRRYLDEDKNRIYEHNKNTGETRWIHSAAEVTLFSIQNDPDCALCLSPLEAKITQFFTPTARTCRHSFHPGCMHLLSNKTCPVCRKEFSYTKVVPNPWLTEAPYSIDE